MPTLIKMSSFMETTQESATVGDEKKKYVNLGLVVLVAVLIVIVIFIVFKCKLKCGPNRESYCRFSWANDTAGTAYGKKTPVDFAGPSNAHISMQDDPHYKANPHSKYLPCDQAPVDFYATLRSLTENYETDPNSLLTPPFHEFGQWFEGERGCGVGKPWVNNEIGSRWDFKDRGDMPTTRSLNNQPQQGHFWDCGMTYPQTLGGRQVNQLSDSQESPNVIALPGLEKYNKKMDAVITRDLDLTI